LTRLLSDWETSPEILAIAAAYFADFWCGGFDFKGRFERPPQALVIDLA
jgi:hypothetical protein